MKFTKKRRKARKTGYTAEYRRQMEKQFYELSAGKSPEKTEILKKALSISLNP